MRFLVLAALSLAPPAAAQTLVIGNKAENTVSFVDLATSKEVRRVPTGPEPHEIAFSPDGRQVAVVAYGGSSIDVFDVAGGERLERIDLGGNRRPHGIAWLPDGRILTTTEGSGTLTAVMPKGSGERIRAYPTGAKGSHMVVTHGGTAYVPNMGSGTVTRIDLDGKRPNLAVAAGPVPEGIALSADGARLWVASRDENAVRVFDTATMKEVGRAPTGETPIRVAITPDGRTAVVSNFGAGTLSLIDTATLRPTRTITLGGSAEAGQVTMLFSPDGRRLYVAETGPDMVAEVDLVAGKVLLRLPAGKDGDGLALSPVTAR